MITVINCFLAVNAQPVDFPTYKAIDCDLHVNENDDNFFGKIIDCSLTVQRVLVGACLATAQSIRLKITVDGEDVSAALVGQVMIQHNENLISTFSFDLGDFQYSPLLVGDYEDKEVVITAYVNGQEVKLFTGLVDSTRSDYDGGYRLTIYGSDYGKKLLKRMTLISVQEAATAKTRGAIIRYLANQADITNMDVPTGSKTEIDHSFQDQFIWDMIQKEMMIEGWVIRFDENGKMLVYKKVIKTNETLYPTPDWEYGEDKFILVGLNTTREGIINQITILGAIFEEETITANPVTPVKVIPNEKVYEYTNYSFSPSFTVGEVITGWSEGDAVIKVTAFYTGYTKPLGYLFPVSQNYKFKITGSDSGKIQGLSFSISGGATKAGQSSNYVLIERKIGYEYPPLSATEREFSITITFKIKNQTGGGIEELEEENPEETFTSTITHTQIKAIVNDPVSIAKYGERKPNEEGTEEYPLAETQAQCIDIGQRRIRDSHRYIKQPDFQVNFNPKMMIGEAVKLTDKKIGYNERWYLEEIIHYFDIDSRTGAIKPRSRIGCVFYA